MNVLIAIENKSVARSLQLSLEKAGITVLTTDRGKDCIGYAKCKTIDLIIIEMNLPDMAADEIIHSIRTSRVTTPILALIEEDDSEGILKSFGLGVDDFLTKSFSRDELLARIRKAVHQYNGKIQTVIKIDSLEVDIDSQKVSVSGIPVKLSKKEYRLMEILSLRKETILSKDFILDQLYAGCEAPEKKIVDVFVCKLRSKIKRLTGGNSYIETVWGRGYALREPRSSANDVITTVTASEV